MKNFINSALFGRFVTLFAIVTFSVRPGLLALTALALATFGQVTRAAINWAEIPRE